MILAQFMSTSRIIGIAERDNEFFSTDGEEQYRLLGGKGFSTAPGEQVKISISSVTAEQRPAILSVFNQFQIKVIADEMEPQFTPRKERPVWDPRRI